LQAEFNYTSPHWTSNETYAVQDGLEGLTEKQTKLASYFHTPFNKLCLGMKVKNVTKWIAIDHKASSMFSVIAKGSYTSTSIGREAWKSLISDSNIQQYCNREGFNVQMGNNYNPDAYVKIRIGLASDNVDSCASCDSCIGFGISLRGCDGDKRNSSVGNIFARCTTPEFDRDNAAFGFVLVH
jgi:hypothetical protein